MNNIERELKIALTEEEYNLLLTASNARPQLQTNFYFYCDGIPRETVVRVRLKQGGGYLLCFKRLLSAHNGINVCDEREQSIDVKTAESFIADGLSADELKTRLDVDGGLSYRCIGKLDTYRAKFTEKQWTLELDRNEYLGVTDYELECECESDVALENLKEYLLITYGIAFKPSAAKSGRFFGKYFKKN